MHFFLSFFGHHRIARFVSSIIAQKTPACLFTNRRCLLLCLLWCWLGAVQTWLQPVVAQSRKVIVENLTGAWCGFCPDGAYTVNQLANNFDNIICIAAHIDDPMANNNSTEIGDAYSGGGVNVLMLDRYLFDDEQFVQFTSQYDPIALQLANRLSMPTLVGVTISNVSYDADIHQLMVTVEATFTEIPTGYSDLRLNLWIVEDSIVNSASAYSQVNFFDGYAGHPYFGAGNPIPNYMHQHVLRAALGSTWGTPNSIGNGTSITAGQVFSHTYTATLDPSWQVSRLSLVGLVQHYNEEETNREILNAEQINLSEALSPTVATGTVAAVGLANCIDLRCYPNPVKANTPITIEYQIEKAATQLHIALYDAQGNTVKIWQNEAATVGRHQFVWQGTSGDDSPLPSGVYTLHLITKERGAIAQQTDCVLLLVD